METTKLDFTKNIMASVSIKDLEELGWEFDPTYEDVAKAKGINEQDAKAWENENYFVVITVDEKGNTFWNSQSYEGNNFSDREATGDDAQTIEDLKQLYNEGKLWNVENN